VTASAKLLRNDDNCSRLAILNQSWERHTITPIDLLRRAVDFGLESDADDPGLAAGDEHFRLCATRGIETDSPDLIGIADHGSALANFLVWIIRTEGPWDHPEDVQIGKEWWESSAYLSGNKLRQVWITDRWDQKRQIEAEHSWFVQGECAAYQLPMDLLVCLIGQRRDNRWHSPLTQGWLHPVNQDLRFQKRNGEGFDGNWQRIWRENFKGCREDWLASLTEDGVLAELVQVHRVDVSPHYREIRSLAEANLVRLRSKTVPPPQLSQCDRPPCQFRCVCPYFQLPSEESGFVRLQPEPEPQRTVPLRLTRF